MIRPHVEIFSARAFKRIEEIIMAGEEETLNMMPAIKDAINYLWRRQRGDK